MLLLLLTAMGGYATYRHLRDDGVLSVGSSSGGAAVTEDERRRLAVGLMRARERARVQEAQRTSALRLGSNVNAGAA